MSLIAREVHCECTLLQRCHRPSACTGDVKEFGFRPIPEDGNYASHFSGDTTTPRADTGDPDATPFSGSRPAESDSDLIDLGQAPPQGQSQVSDEGSAGVDRIAVEKAISDADSASKQQHPHLHQRHQHEQGKLRLFRHAPQAVINTLKRSCFCTLIMLGS